MDALAIRVGTEADVDVLLGMMRPFNDFEGIPFDEAAFRAPLIKLLRDHELGAALVFEAGATLGYAIVTWGFDLEFGGRDAFLTEFWIRRQARGAGLGRKALALIEEFAKSRGAHALHLGVRPENAVAVRLYETGGYADWPRRFLSKLL